MKRHIKKIYDENNVSIYDLLTNHTGRINYKAKFFDGWDIDSVNDFVKYGLSKLSKEERIRNINPWLEQNIKHTTKLIKREIRKHSDCDVFEFYDNGTWALDGTAIYLVVD